MGRPSHQFRTQAQGALRSTTDQNTTTTHIDWADVERACADRTPIIIGGRRVRVTGLGTCPAGHCYLGATCPGLVYLHTDDTGPVRLALPAVHLAGGPREYRLEIVTDPDPDVPAALMHFRADGTAAAIAQGRWLLAALDGPGDRYGELYQHHGDTADFLTTLHLGA